MGIWIFHVLSCYFERRWRTSHGYNTIFTLEFESQYLNLIEMYFLVTYPLKKGWKRIFSLASRFQNSLIKRKLHFLTRLLRLVAFYQLPIWFLCFPLLNSAFVFCECLDGLKLRSLLEAWQLYPIVDPMFTLTQF